jgi:hypothetical protein
MRPLPISTLSRFRASALSLAVLAALLASVASPPVVRAADCSQTSVGLTPISDLGHGTYQGTYGGLYPGSVDFRPVAHERAGESLAQGIGPLDAKGTPDPHGKYVLLGVGMSNAAMEFHGFQELAGADTSRDPRLVMVNGAQSGAVAGKWADPRNRVWTVVDSDLAAAGVTPKQVAVAWVKMADANPFGPWPDYARRLSSEMATIARNLHARYPNLQLAYYSSRTYGGYAITPLNPEPYAYQSGFSVKWVIRDQIDGQAALGFDPSKGTVEAPWLSWGPYLWADGLHPRSDGLTWACKDFGSDGTHPSRSGVDKVAGMLLNFFHSDSTARQWYLANPAQESHSREVSLSITNGVATGALTADDGFGACTQAATVDVQRKSHGRWSTVGQATTGKLGHYHVGISGGSGTYRAKAPRSLLAGPGSDICLKGFGGPVRFTPGQ